MQCRMCSAAIEPKSHKVPNENVYYSTGWIQENWGKIIWFFHWECFKRLTVMRNAERGY